MDDTLLLDTEALKRVIKSMSSSLDVGLSAELRGDTAQLRFGECSGPQSLYEFVDRGQVCLRVSCFSDSIERRERAKMLVASVLTPWLQALRKSNEQKQHYLKVVEEAYRDLSIKNRKYKHALERLEEVDRLKSNFLATVSHELRTPLTSVIGYSEMLLEGLSGELNAGQKEYVSTILSKADHLLQIITGILDVSLLESGSAKLKSKPVVVSDLIASAVAAFDGDAKRRDITIHQPSGSVPRGLADPQKLKQALLHLVANAIKFSPDGGKIGISLEVGPLAPEDQSVFGSPFWKGSLGERFGLRLSVSDSGIGISDDEQERIFDSFFQVDQGATREYGGAGLGLSLVKGYIEAHGGSIWVESEHGRGATFTISIPAMPDELESYAESIVPESQVNG